MSDTRSPGPLPRREYVFSVAEIFNLPYHRFVIGGTLRAGDSWQVKNLRYGRLQVCATGAASTLNTFSGVTEHALNCETATAVSQLSTLNSQPATKPCLNQFD